MNILLSPIIYAGDLLNIFGNDRLIIVDASNGRYSKENYQQQHVKGALFVDLNTQLSEIKENLSNGGRHPLPTLQHFSNTLAAFGISQKNHVVVYDDKNGANAAARFWWMLKAAGHNKVQVLNGGLQAAEKAGIPLRSGQETITPSTYPLTKWQLPVADINDVTHYIQEKNQIVLDVRDKDRYEGLNEPLDPIAGHIPGTINIPFSENLGAGGLFKSPEELRKKYEPLFQGKDPKDIIVHCGSGVTACHTLLALDYAGLGIPKLYVGSWSEWSRNNKPIATGEK